MYMMSNKEGNKMTPYLIGGAGVYHGKASITESNVTVDTSENKFGIRGGVGLNWMMSQKMGLGFQADYNDVFTSGSKTQFLGVSGGLHWTLPSH
jgi:outer membrane autotransporter protein